jgi:hypothetical protein
MEKTFSLFYLGVDLSLKQHEPIAQIHHLLHTLSSTFDRVQPSIPFSDLLEHLTAEEQEKLDQLINKFISYLPR